jgi:hypothetical protein
VRHHLNLVDEQASTLAKAAMAEALRVFERPGGVILRGRAILVTASASTGG